MSRPSALRRYLDLLRPYRRTYVVGLVLLALTNGLNLLVPWLVKVGVDDLARARGIAAGAPVAGLERPADVLLALVVVGLGLAIVRTGSRLALLGVGRTLARDLRDRLFARLLVAPPSYFARFPTGEVMSRSIGDVGVLQSVAAAGVLYLFNALFMLGVAAPWLVALDPWLAALVLAPFPVLALLTWALAERVRTYTTEAQAALALLTRDAQETIAGVEVVKAFVLEERQAARFQRSNDRYLDRSLREATVRSVIAVLSNLTGGLGTTAILWVGGSRVAEGRMSYGDLALFLTVLALVVRPIVLFGWIVGLVQRGLAALDRVEELSEARPPAATRRPLVEAERGFAEEAHGAASRADSLSEATAEGAEARPHVDRAMRPTPKPPGRAQRELSVDVPRDAGAPPPAPPDAHRGPVQGDVELRALTYRYPVAPGAKAEPARAGVIGSEAGGGGKRGTSADAGRAQSIEPGPRTPSGRLRSRPLERRLALDQVSLRAPAGGVVGLTGRIGSGKSTLLEAIPGFLEVKGAVLVDGVPLERWDLSALRAGIGWVPQDGYVFSLSLRENVMLGRPDAAPVEVERAVAVAELSRDLDQLQDGLETLVGERGVTLSGGQRQRLAIARAVLVRPSILLLDDALAMVDAETASTILGNLRRALPGTTMLVAAHRAATLLGADEVLVLEQGRIVERGSPAELLAQDGGRFATMVERQRLQAALEAA